MLDLSSIIKEIEGFLPKGTKFKIEALEDTLDHQEVYRVVIGLNNGEEFRTKEKVKYTGMISNLMRGKAINIEFNKPIKESVRLKKYLEKFR